MLELENLFFKCVHELLLKIFDLGLLLGKGCLVLDSQCFHLGEEDFLLAFDFDLVGFSDLNRMLKFIDLGLLLRDFFLSRCNFGTQVLQCAIVLRLDLLDRIL